MKFKLQSIDKEDGTVVTHEFEVETWYESLDSFVKFLRGSGYLLKNNSVGINLGAGHMFVEDDPYYNITFFDSKED